MSMVCFLLESCHIRRYCLNELQLQLDIRENLKM